MGAIFFKSKDGEAHIISNQMSIISAGFRPAKSYYNVYGASLQYYTHPDGVILANISRPRRQSWKQIYASPAEANEHFKDMNRGKTFKDGKWVPERKK